jgi:PAS domain S-box-containing protein
MSGVLEETRAIFGSDRAWLLYPCDPNSAMSRVVMEHTRPEYPGAFALGEEFPVGPHGAEILRRVRDGPGAVTDLIVSPEIRERFRIQSVLAIAVRPKGDRPYLFGLHQCSHTRAWTAAERRLFGEIARRLEDSMTSVLAHRNLLASEEELRASERKYRNLVDTTPAFVHTALPSGDLDFFNRGWLEYLGVSITDLLGWRWWTKAIHHEDREELLNKWRASIESGQPLFAESRVRRADGEYRWFLHRKQPQRNEEGEIVKWYGSSIEIEERKIAEEAIRRGEAFLAEGQRLSHTGTWGWNASTGKLTWSEEHFRILGLDPQVTRASQDVFWERIHPDDKIGLRRTFESAIKEKRNFEQEFRIVTPDWSIRHLHGVGHAVLSRTNELVEFIGSTMDITERKRAEERAQSQREAISLALNAFVEELDVNRFLGDVIAELNKQFHAKSWELWLFDEAIRALLLHSSSHPTEHFSPEFGDKNARPQEELQGIWQIKDAARVPKILELPSQESLLSQRHGESLKRRGIKTLMIVPLILGEQNLGFLELHFQPQTPFSSDDLELVQALVNHATLALQLNRLTRRAEQLAVTEERNRLAREIHDTLAQAFVGIVLHGEALGTSLGVSKSRSNRALMNINKLARAGLEEARRSVQALRPKVLEGFTLPEALEDEAKRLSADAETLYTFEQRGRKVELSADVQAELFRIAQEAMTNVRKHARATSAWIILESGDDHVVLTVGDDGIGLATTHAPEHKRGYGQATMRERAQRIGGRLEVESPATGGTTVRVNIPVNGGDHP